MSIPILTDSNLKLSAIVISALLVSACATSKDELLPHGENIMLDVWDQGTAGGAGSTASRQLLDARQGLRRPLATETEALEANKSFSRTSQNEIYSQFKRLPNPDLVMYVYPHLAGSDPAPIPGYSTVFPLYQRVQYAMPGERTEAY